MSKQGKLILVFSVILNILLVVSVGMMFMGTQKSPQKNWHDVQSTEGEPDDIKINPHSTHTSHTSAMKQNKTAQQETKKVDNNSLQQTSDKLPDFDYSSIINADTIDYFKHLSVMFPGISSIDGHFDKILEFLLTKYPKEQAEALFQVYKKYFKCETDLKNERVSWGFPKSADDWLEYIKRTYEFRLNSMGGKVGGLLFGTDYKKLSYKLKKSKILQDETLYGSDKEKWLEELGKEVWGDESQSTIYGDVNSSFDIYKQKMELYKKDLEEMTEEEKQEKIKEFRDELLTPELIENLEVAEKRTAEGKKRFESYKSEEQAIMQDPDMDETQKNERIKELQDKTYGVHADAFRRGQNILKETQEAAKKFQKNK
ncbi:Proteobacterial lipase chaperone [Candidatus Magnetomorum sp. HK-1]|nr:Proteobacterial lipase chaperone [Candidatus Magnetomorum sp. HK-1]